ncbi:Olfactory receptor 14A2 [Heterocephalus glaber]|nr:Olfactory receptor 14A2 [Heterocephalus glaber]
MTSFSASETCVLTVMSYDHYVAICCPLHYEATVNGNAFVLRAGFSWAMVALSGAMYTAGTFFGPFCGCSAIPEFFFNVPSLFMISCTDMLLVVYSSMGIRVCLSPSCCVFIVFSYVHILSTVLRIPSRKGQSKSFSTCLPHLVVFTVFMISAFMVYLRPPSDAPPVIGRLLPVIYVVLPPILNPVIYTLRNGDMKQGLRRLLPALPAHCVHFI